LHLFYVGNDDHIYHVWQTAPNNGWSAHVRVTSIPVGHFVTRSIMYRLKKDFAKGGKSAGKTAADLAGQGSPASSDLLDLNKLKGSDSLTSILLNAFGGWAQFARDEDKRVKLFNGQQKSVDQAKVDYANLDSLWVSRFGGGEYAKSTVWKSVIADATGDFLGWFAQKSALEQGAKLVVMGHTHVPQLGLVVQAGQGQAAVNYINSGFMCPAKPDVGKKKNPARFTFAMIDRKPGKDSTPELHQVNNNYLVEKTSAPPAVITYTPLPGGDFSCYVWVENNTGKELQRLKMEAGQGAFVVNPPEKIGIGQTVGFWIQDYLGFGGSQGAVVYQTLNKRAPQLFLLQFACPTGFGNNFCSGLGTTFETKSGSGDWQNKVVEKDHPFFVRFHIK
jgi:hypothetical protein